MAGGDHVTGMINSCDSNNPQHRFNVSKNIFLA